MPAHPTMFIQRHEDISLNLQSKIHRKILRIALVPPLALPVGTATCLMSFHHRMAVFYPVYEVYLALKTSYLQKHLEYCLPNRTKCSSDTAQLCKTGLRDKRII